MPVLSLRRSLLMLTLAAALCGMQVLRQNTPTHSVSGSVTNAVTGEPIRRALVEVAGHSALTGADGRFQIEGLAEGQAYVNAQRPGFFNEQSLNNTPYAPPNTLITIGPATPEINIKLIPAAGIHGRILDPDGEPIEGVELQLVSEEIVNGWKQLTPRGGTTSDDAGAYRFDDLTPGSYFLATTAHLVFQSYWNQPVDANSPSEAYAPQFYPNSPDIASAERLELKGADQRELDFTLRPERAFRVSGAIAGFHGGVGPVCEDDDGQNRLAGFQMDHRSGRFAARIVRSGSCTLKLRMEQDQGNIYYAQQEINVASSDIDGVQMAFQPGASIRVITNRAEGEALQVSGPVGRENRRDVSVQLAPADRRGNAATFFFPPQAQGDPLTFRGVAPARYKVTVDAFNGHCVESVFYGSTDLTRETLVVAPGSGSPPITVALRSDCAALNGTVRSSNGNTQGVAVLLSESLADSPKLAQLQPNGSFAFQDLSPGQYRVYAFSSLIGVEYANPEALRGFSSEEVKLTANQKANVTVDLIVRGNNQ